MRGKDAPLALVIDGYIDEPGSLGVPPFLHPLVRTTYGAAKDAGCVVEYVPVDRLRQGMKLPKADYVAVLSGSAVPGKYIRASPASRKELLRWVDLLPGITLLGGPAALDLELSPFFDVVSSEDPAAAFFDIINNDSCSPRWRSPEEWDRWSLLGAETVLHHPDFPRPLIVEMETYRGCVRYRSGGCSFCVEPLKGRPRTRPINGILAEAKRLHELGVVNFRLGAQTCIVSYLCEDDGSDRPRPNPEALEKLFSGLAKLAPEVLHVDNANPAIIVEYPEESRLILESLVRHCTSGNVLALGLESADPQVMRANNLNASAEEAFQAIRLINDVGKERGPSGLPALLPGINFIVGLEGETERTLELDLEFLHRVLISGLLLRRINIRQVLDIRRAFSPGVNHGQFLRFKESVRQEIDHPMLQRLVPPGTVLRDVYLELQEGKVTFGRQTGTYPLLVGFPYLLPTGQTLDCKVVGWGQRSVTAVQFPLSVNTCHITALEALPGVGRKRAMRLFRGRPYSNDEEFISVLDDRDLGRQLLEYITLGRGSD